MGFGLTLNREIWSKLAFKHAFVLFNYHLHAISLGWLREIFLLSGLYNIAICNLLTSLFFYINL